jgi:hypothetical protein
VRERNRAFSNAPSLLSFFIPLFDLKHKTHTTRVTGNYHHIAAIVKMVTPARNRYDTVSIRAGMQRLQRGVQIATFVLICGLCASCNVVLGGVKYRKLVVN